MWNKLKKTAVVGTGKSSPPQPPRIGKLGETLQPLAERSSEDYLLSAAGIVYLHERAGYIPSVVDRHTRLPNPAPDDNRPLCNSQAADLLTIFLRERSSELIQLWTTYCVRAGQRVPDRMLPDYLRYVIHHPDLQAEAVEISGKKGAWLADYIPDLAPIFTFPTNNVWFNTDKTARPHLIKRWRHSHPDETRDFLKSIWDAENSNRRDKLVSNLRVNLSSADEAFLETLLDSRSKRVADAAADLLACIPASAYVARMISRVRRQVTYTPKGKGENFTINLPTAVDQAAQRDRIGAKAINKFNDEESQMIRMIAAVPPSFWERELGTTPSDLVSHLKKGRASQILINGWKRAAVNFNDELWAEAIIDHWLYLDYDMTREGDLGYALVAVIAPNRFEQIIFDHINRTGSKKYANYAILLGRHEWSSQLSTTVIDHLVELVKQRRMAYQISQHLDGDLPWHIATDQTTYDYAVAMLDDIASHHYLKKPIQQMLLTLKRRQSLKEQFTHAR